MFVHSYTYPGHELFVGQIARDIGFAQVSMSSQLLPMIKMVPRGVSSTADAYLTPILMEYLDGFFKGFDDRLRRGSGKEAKDAREAGTKLGEEGLHDPRVEFMGSDGGLLDLDNFSGLKSILSGPAGGVVGYALTSWDEERRQPVIGRVINTFSPKSLADKRTLELTWVGHLLMCPGTLVGMRLCTRRLQQGSPFNRPNWTSTP